MKTWFGGQTTAVNTTVYVRHNIHVSLLAMAYAKFAAQLLDRPGLFQIHPSGYLLMPTHTLRRRLCGNTRTVPSRMLG